MDKIERFLTRYEPIILLLLLAAILVVNCQGLSWGLPGRWNPDELVGVVNLALDGLEQFDLTNFDYPSLPKYFMLFIGQVTDSLGYPRATFFVVSRFFSAFLGAMTAWLAYALARQVGARRWSALLAALLMATSSEIALNSHFAHNDMYVTYFAGLTLFLALKYMNTGRKFWLYLAFFSAGLTASSKYNGGIIVLTAVLAYILVEGRQVYRDSLRSFETLFVGAGVSILGYGIGTHTALTSFSFYIKRLMPALWRHANYNRTPSSQPGLLRQWGVMESAFGDMAYALFIISLVAALILGVLWLLKRMPFERKRVYQLVLVVAAVVALDLPILGSYNVQRRFFLPLLAPLAVVSSVMLDGFVDWLRKRGWNKLTPLVMAVIVVILVSSDLRVASVNLSIMNDARTTAGAFILTLPPGASYEYTNYTPNFDETRYKNILGYPLIFLKFPEDVLPEDSRFEYNSGEAGIEERKPDYLVISSLVYDRFDDDYICQVHQADCDFFKRLMAGETNYTLIGDFAYRLPEYLPDIRITFINPDIKIYQRKP
ncbi:MAG: phospholipid carrier-dependent glycosyltransferase [Anaerolineae bacterium]|nr:phospholipid carrier-dependent glycosyltransferase [Anaerolineae bacterium]